MWETVTVFTYWPHFSEIFKQVMTSMTNSGSCKKQKQKQNISLNHTIGCLEVVSGLSGLTQLKLSTNQFHALHFNIISV